MPERYPQRHSSDPEFQHPRFDLSTIMGIPVNGVKVSKEVSEMATTYFGQRTMAERIDKASDAELAFALRRQLQQDLKSTIVRDEATGVVDEAKTKELREKLLTEDENFAFSLSVYRNLILSAGPTLQAELARHETEHTSANGTYETYRTIDRVLEKTQTELNTLLADMFKRAGQEPKPVHLMKRALLEAKMEDLESQLTTVKSKNPDVAALIEYDTIADYARQLRTTGFIWTKSRQKLLQDVLTGALTSRPVMALMGETGSGKTAMARAISIELASREPERTVGGKHAKFERLFGSPSIKAGDTSFDYGPLLRAMTGKQSSRDTEPGKGGGIFFDDEFNTRPTDVQREILKFVSECRPGRKVSIPGTALSVTVEPGFLYLAAGNPPSERYDREETGIETKREFAGNVLNVEYLEQTPDNPELYQVLLSALLDSSTGRLSAVTPKEVQPAWITDKATGESSLDLTPTHGAFLWRFSQAWGELFRAFSHKDTILHKAHPTDPKAKWYLPSFILDPGVVISWMDQYKASPKARRGHLADFLEGKLNDYILQFPEEEQKIVESYLNHFALPKLEAVHKGKKKQAVETQKPPSTVLTPRDIGYLNPNVRRPKEKAQPPKLEGMDVIDPETGEVVGTAEFPESPVPEVIPPEPGELAPFTYDRTKATEYGFSEVKIEAHRPAQQLVDAIFARDRAFVTIYKAGDPDPDSPTTILTQDKFKANLDAIKLYWTQHCQDLPNTPEKSMWFFQALAEHRLSNTIDQDNVKTITNPTSPHIPTFGQKAFLLAMDFKEFKYNNTTEKTAALTPQTKKILKALFMKDDPTSITREEVNTALWSDHENRIQTDKAKNIIKELIGASGNPDDFELRLLHPDEYQRAASSQGYGQKNLWTHMDGYYGHDDGHRYGLISGSRDHGGAADVDILHRGYRFGTFAVRLVLSRKL